MLYTGLPFTSSRGGSPVIEYLIPGIEPGSELGWNMLAGPKPMSLAVEMYKYAAFNGNWDMKDFKVDDIRALRKGKRSGRGLG